MEGVSAAEGRSSCSNVIIDRPCRFMQPLLHGFLNRFSIPVSFLEQWELKGGPLESVVLMTEDQPRRQWLVGVTDGWHFKEDESWKQFCVRHNLQVGDFLVIHINPTLCSKCVYDPLSACHRHFSSTKRNKQEIISEQPKVLCDVPTALYYAQRKLLYLPKEFTRLSRLAKRKCNINLSNEKGILWPVKLSYRKSDNQSFISKGWTPFRIANKIRPETVVRFQLIEAGSIPILKCSGLKNPKHGAEAQAQPPTEIPSEKPKTGAEAQPQAPTKIPFDQPQFLSRDVTITPYSTKRATVFLPKSFIRRSGLTKRSCYIKLTNEQGTPWQVKLSYRPDGLSYIYEGWTDFRIANNINPRSVVKFQLIEAGVNPILKCSLRDSPTTRVNMARKL